MQRMLLLTSFLAFFALVLCDSQCPPANLIEPCICTEAFPVTLQCSGITRQETFENVFTKSLDYPIQSLIIEHSTFMYFPATLVHSKELSYITIANSTMASIFNEQPGPTNKISDLTLVNSTFQRGIDWELFKHLKPKALQIEGTEVRRIGAGFYDNMRGSLRTLALVNTKTMSFHSKAFAKQVDMRALVCQNGLIKTIKRSMFPDPSGLLLLDLVGNRIQNLPDDIFRNMPALGEVYLDNNQLVSFTATVWENPYDRSLFTVSLRGNPLLCDCKIRWFMRKTKYVGISGNCAEPDTMKGKKLRELKDKDFSYCRKAPTLL